MKKLALAIMLSLGVLISGCGNQQQPQQQVKQVCQYDNVDLKAMGSYSASQPVIDAGMTFSFSNSAKLYGKTVDVTDDGKQVVYATAIQDGKLCLYEIDVTGKDGWDKLENTNNVYKADEVNRYKMLCADLVDAGIYPMDLVNDINDLGKFINVTTIKGHLEHTHIKGCK